MRSSTGTQSEFLRLHAAVLGTTTDTVYVALAARAGVVQVIVGEVSLAKAWCR